jgi:Concanavalin A-like lectin/glucanases superfamily
MATYRGSETILDYVNSGIPDGDHTFITTANDEEVSIDVEVINITENTIYTEAPTLGNDTPDERMLILKYHGDLTINAGVTLTPQVRKKGMFLYVKGHLINNGTISMTARGANAEGQNVYMFKNTDKSVCFVPAVGAPEMAGGRQANYTSSKTYAPKGNSGTGRQTGGGGTGAGRGATGGASAAGTSYSGGSGGGSGAYNINGLPAEPNGGKGGDGRNGNMYTTGAGGGAGNPGGSGHGTYGNAGEEGTGGLLIVVADDVTNNGTIESNGSQGGNGYRAGGGGSGGGHVEIATVSPASLIGAVSVAGGRYGDGTRGSESGAGGSGGDGTFSQENVILTINKYLFQDGEDIKTYSSGNGGIASVLFDGGYMTALNAATPLNTTDISLGMWIKTTVTANSVPFETDISNTGIQFQIMSGGTMAFGYATTDRVETPSSIADGKWHFLVGTYRRSTRELKIYQDGVLKASRIANTPYPSTMKDFVVGSRYGSYAVTGHYDNLTVWSKVLTDEEVADMMQNGVDTSNSNLIAMWSFEEVAGALVEDISQNNYTGTLSGNFSVSDDVSEQSLLQDKGWKTIGSAPVTKAMFDENGMSDLSVIDNEALEGLISDTPELLCWTDEDAPISSDALSESSNTETASGQIKEFIIHQDDYYNKIQSIAK